MKAVLQENKIIGTSSPEEAIFTGAAAAGYSKRIAVGRNGQSRAAEMALCSGIISSGSDVILLGKCMETELFFASRLTGCDLCLYIKEEPLMKIEVRAKGGLPLDCEANHFINEALKERSMPEIFSDEGTITDGQGFREVYKQHIEGLISKECPYSIKLSRTPGTNKLHFPENDGEELVIQLSSDGTKASVYAESCGFLSYEKLIFICCMDLFENGKDVGLPFEFPFSADNFAAKYGCKVHRYFSCSDGYSDDRGRKLAREQNFTLDGLFLALRFIDIITRKGVRLKDVPSMVPDFYVTKKFIELDKDRVEGILNHWEGSSTPGGTTFAKNENRVVMQPSSSGKGLWVQIESRSMETAAELCGRIEEKLKNDEF
ncbi:hypothetical protein [Porcipelethomonas sp.]|uniref:hypothetical protein n=1 Tax=Porcipelethomonas sp. TaxID=2981675 RepID=UPI003EF39F7F